MFFKKVFLILTILSTFVVLMFADEYIVDNDDGSPGYVETGSWTTSTSTGYNGGTYRYVIDTEPAASATWTPDIINPARYEVYAIIRTSTNRTTDAPYTIVHSEGTDIVHISQYGSNMVQELYIGEYNFDAGTGGYVQLNNSGGTGAYISDAIKFVTYEDTPPVITNLSYDPGYPSDTDTVDATAEITDDGSVTSATLHYNSTPNGTSGSVTAYDDGLHNDGSAGDDIFGASIPPQPDGDTVEFYFTAEDNTGQPTTSSGMSYIVGEEAPREYRCIWADSWGTGFLNQSQADTFIQTCRDNNINTIIPEVRKIGDAYYDSNIEPRATNISGGSSYDPLGYLISSAHDTSGGKKYIEVHAWFVMHRITTGETLDPQHVLSQHPEYVMYDSTGSTGADTKFLDPGHPGTVDHNVAVIVDCLTNYDIDGINLDYIRYPEASGDWGYNPVSVARFNEIYGKSGQPSPSDPDWCDWRRECVTLEVKKVYVKSLMVNPNVVLTADTVNWGYDYDDWENSSAYAGVFQDWVRWLQDGIIDYNALMDYSTSASRYEGWCNLSLANDDKRGSIIGIGAYLQSSVQDSMDQLLYARNAGAAGLNIYDYYSEVNATKPTQSRAEFYSELKSQLFPEWEDPPIHTWKSSPTTGIVEGNLTAGGIPVDHGTVMINGQVLTAVPTDGSGWYAILDVPTGLQQFRFSKTGYSDVVAPAQITQAGDIVTLDVDFTASVSDWQIY